MSGEQDIREITILKPAERSKQKEMVYKRMFVKSNPNELGMLDLWNRIQRQTALHRMGTKFVLTCSQMGLQNEAASPFWRLGAAS